MLVGAVTPLMLQTASNPGGLPLSVFDGFRAAYLADRALFCADVPESAATRMAAGQRPVTELALNEPSGEPAWKQIPSWFIFGDCDKNIPVAALRFMAKPREMMEIPGASHVVGISYADTLGELILRAAGHNST